MKARIWVAQGRLAQALDWVREQELCPDDELCFLHEFEHITLARIRIAQYQHNRMDGAVAEVMLLLDRLLQAAEEGSRMGSVIEILVLQALAFHAQGNVTSALVPLERALTLAEPEGYVPVFIDEGPPMTALLRSATKHGIAPNYVSQLLTAFGEPAGKKPFTQPSNQPAPLFEPAALFELIIERELEVLRLLRTELSGPEVARELMVSLNTVRTHTQNIYAKLGVNNRRAAVHRAEELNLL